MRVKEISVRLSAVVWGCSRRSSPKHHLIDHEFAVIFADRSLGGFVARIWQIGAAGELPAIAKQSITTLRHQILETVQLVAGSRVIIVRDCFPFEFCRQSRPGPGRKCIRFVIGYVRYRRVGIACLPAIMGELLVLVPVKWCLDLFTLDPGPAIRQPQRGGLVPVIRHKFVPLRIGDQ